MAAANRCPIVVIGMACEFPGAHSPNELWQNLLAGRRYFRKAPPERLPPEYFDPDPDTPGKSYCDQMALITDWQFDPVEFRIPPVTFHATDMAHWLALYTAREAIRDSGIELGTLDRTRVGVMLGNSLTGEFSRSHNLRFRWPYVERGLQQTLARFGLNGGAGRELISQFRQAYEAPLPEITEDTLAGNMSNTIAGRIANHFNFGGGAFAVDGACSSSLLSIALACQALANGELDLALAGGVDVSLDPFEIVGFAKTKALATDDIRPYDARANGMLTGEGCGMVLLMREADARAAGYPLRAVIRGWGYSSDGAGGITAPDRDGQLRALRKAYARAAYPLSTVGYLEGHGTGTPLGDQVELSAVQQLLRESSGAGSCAIGSIKANIGHCKAAAGVAGFIKAVLALQRKIIPPTLNCDQPNPLFQESATTLRPSRHGQAWTAGSTPRRAAVSAMGFGGANAHLTLEETHSDLPPNPTELAWLGSAQSSELIVLAADTVGGLKSQAEALLPVARRICRAELTDLSAALVEKPPVGPLRVAVVADSPWALAGALEAVSAKLNGDANCAALDDPAAGVFAGTTREQPLLVGLFPGQGAQRLNMGEHWHRRFPFVRDFYQRAGQLTADLLPPGRLAELIFRDGSVVDEQTRSAWENELRPTQIAQPALTLSSLAALQGLQFLGLSPGLVIGHSLGELGALSAAGVWEPAAAVRLAALRGRAMAELALDDPGGMLSVAAPAETVQTLIAPMGPALGISNCNSPRQTVVSGHTAAIEQLKKLCADRKLPCRQLAVSHAFHSPLVAPAADALHAALGASGPRLATPANDAGVEPLFSAAAASDSPSGQAQFISTVTGRPLEPGMPWADYLASQIRRPVRFIDAVLQAAEARPALWLEIGPGGVLTHFVRDILGADKVCCLPTDLPNEDGFHLLNQVLARAWVLGVPVRLDRLFAHRFHRPFDPRHYQPRFIVNPCERPVKLPPGDALAGTVALPATLLPADARPEVVAAYLQRRTDFLRELIAVDFRHFANNGSTAGPTGPARPGNTDQSDGTKKQKQVAASAKSPGPPACRDDLLTFTIDWIAKRTGYPKHTISPEKKLQEDLNLDSIKAGELMVLLAHKLGRPFEADPLTMANASLAELVDRIWQNAAAPASAAAAPTPDERNFAPVNNLAPWIRSFVVNAVPAPLDQEANAPLPATGQAIVVAEPGCPMAPAIVGRLQSAGLTAEVRAAVSVVNGDAPPPDLTALVCLLPSAGKSFLECNQEEFVARLEGQAIQLFNVFQWAIQAGSATRLPPRMLVLRPIGADAVNDQDLDGGSAMLKSLRREEPEANLKWLALPAAWAPEQWAETVLRELQTAPGRVAYRYTPEGQRFTEAAVPLAGGETAPPQLDARDVALVSGGGKGVTFELARALARETKVKLALLGSSPEPDLADGAAEDELSRNLRRLAEAGIDFCYVQADVTDPVAARAAVANIERRLGSVTALLHGAGLTRLRRFSEKSRDEFLGCLRVKALGFFNLLQAIGPSRLKAVHAITSVLGHTGMHGQTDYAFANAWLAGAIRAVQAAYPQVHCLALGYTAWAETGLAAKTNALTSLQAMGVTPLSNEEGVAAFLNLLRRPPSSSTVVITGRLTPELETVLYGPVPVMRGRFLERVRRFVPGVELVSEAVLSHRRDVYLPEHVYEGTAVFPGVMAMEAMVQAAMACAGKTALPKLRQVKFHRPLIVPEAGEVILRTLALADRGPNDEVRIQVALRAGGDGFKQTYCESECIYGGPPVQPSKPPEQLPEPIQKDTEDFCPVPLFQGKFFRRIQAIRVMALERESLTDIQVPNGELYFRNQEEPGPAVCTPSPAVRDACLQSGALILPPGCLPRELAELGFHAPLPPDSRIRCATRVREHHGGEYLVDIDVFDENGVPLETMRGLRLQAPVANGAAVPKQPPKPIRADRIAADLQALLPRAPLAFAWRHNTADPNALTPPSPPNPVALRSALKPSKLDVARQAALGFARQYLKIEMRPEEILLSHAANGQPVLACENAAAAEMWQETGVSLTDTGEFSAALVGRAPVGLDLEPVAARDAETWRGLLGHDGYALALAVAAQTAEPFDRSATRVWTLLETARKAGAPQRLVPGHAASLGGPWLCFSTEENDRSTEFLSVILTLPSAGNALAALALTVRFRVPAAREQQELPIV